MTTPELRPAAAAPTHKHRHSDGICAEVAAGQDGAIGLEQLRGAGLTDGGIDRRRRNGRLHPIHRGVYAWGHPKLGPRGYLWAAHLATGGVKEQSVNGGVGVEIHRVRAGRRENRPLGKPGRIRARPVCPVFEVAAGQIDPGDISGRQQ